MVTVRSLVRNAAVLGALSIAAAPVLAGDEWPQFRGAGARGIADGQALAMTWDVESGKNLAWKTTIPGLGHSAPAIWGDAVFLTSAISGKGAHELRTGLYGDIDPVLDDSVHTYLVLRIDRGTGKIVWQRTAHEGVPKVKRHQKASHANPTPATDGKRVVAFFGSEGLYCYDMDGNPKWKKDFGTLVSAYYEVPEAHWGFASSPVIHEGKVIVLADVIQDSFLAAFDLETGRELWRTKRGDVPGWGSPTVHVESGRSQVLVNGHHRIGGYDLATGKELWWMDGGGDIPIPTPYVWDGKVFLTSAHGGPSPILALSTNSTGNISPKEDGTASEYVAWSLPNGGSYMPTTVVYGDLLYVLRDNGVFTTYEARTGKTIYQERLGSGSFVASLVAGDGKIYAQAEDGDVHVIKAGKTFEVLATNELGEVALATPAIAGGTLFFRTKSRLVAVQEKPAPPPPPVSPVPQGGERRSSSSGS